MGGVLLEKGNILKLNSVQEALRIGLCWYEPFWPFDEYTKLSSFDQEIKMPIPSDSWRNIYNKLEKARLRTKTKYFPLTLLMRARSQKVQSVVNNM